jgi:hypothetical protein
MTQNEWRWTALIMSKIGMHIGPADTACIDADKDLAIL